MKKLVPMKKVIVENGITILDDHQFSDEVKQVLSVRASSRKIDYRTLSVKTYMMWDNACIMDIGSEKTDTRHSTT